MSDIIASPSVRARALQMGVDIERRAAELGRSTIGLEDLEGQASSATSQSSMTRYWDVDHSQYGPVHEEPMSRFAQIAAANLAAATHIIPSVTHHDRADQRAIEDLRQSWKEEAAAKGIKLTALAFHIKALARCLKEYPRFNASLSADEKTLTLKDYVHIGIAVDTPHGLMVPVIRDADQKGLLEIASELSDLAKRAQKRKISPEEMGGASMTISNLGGIGGTAFTPIVNPPEVAILGITRTQIEAIWDGEKFVPVPMVPLDLTYDHRVINGADAAKFLSYYARLLAYPRHLMI